MAKQESNKKGLDLFLKHTPYLHHVYWARCVILSNFNMDLVSPEKRERLGPRYVTARIKVGCRDTPEERKNTKNNACDNVHNEDIKEQENSKNDAYDDVDKEDIKGENDKYDEWDDVDRDDNKEGENVKNGDCDNVDKEDNKEGENAMKDVGKKDTKDCSIYVTCVHLGQTLESTRMREIQQINSDLLAVFSEGQPQIWVGDFNCLTREDYSQEEWDEVYKVRKKNRWELPQCEVTRFIAHLGFDDCWAKIGRPTPTSTCRFNTHIDYVFDNSDLDSMWECSSVIHHLNRRASDHSFVMATFHQRGNCNI